MRYKLEFRIKSGWIDMDYRPFLLSFLKKSLQNSNETLYNRFFAQDIPTYKPYTFAVWLPRATFADEVIALPDNTFYMLFSTYDLECAIHMINGFMSMRNKNFPLPQDNRMQLYNLEIVNEIELRMDSIYIRFMSPLLVRDHNSNGEDRYLLWEDKEFLKYLRETVRYQVERVPELEPSMVNSLELHPMGAKKTVVRYYGQYIDANIGTYIMNGQQRLLNHLYRSGIGSRRGSGFGMFDVLGTVGG